MAVSLEGVFTLIDRASPALSSIERRANAADRALNSLGRTMDKMEVRKLTSDIGSLTGNVGRLDTATQKVDRTVSKHTSTQRGLQRAMSDSSNQTRQTTTEFSKFEQILKRVAIAGAGLRELLVPEKFILIISALKPATAALSALGAGAVALVQQVGSATGAIVPLIARAGDLAGAGVAAATALISVKAAAEVTKFAMAGVQQAIGGNVNAFKKLTPQARAFVLEMRKLQPVLNTLRDSAQKGLFGGLTAAVKTVRSGQALPVLNQASGGMGTAVGNVASNAASQLTTPQTLRDFQTVSATADVVISRLGGAVVDLAQAFLGLMAAASPLTKWLAATVEQWAAYLDQQVKIKTATGDLQRYFEQTRVALTNLGHAARDFGEGILNILRTARGETTSFGSGIATVAAQFRRWTEDIHNEASVALYFEHAQNAAHRLGAMLVDIVKIMGGLGTAARSLGVLMTGGLLGQLDHFSDWVNSFKGQNVIVHWMSDSVVVLKQLWGLVTDLGKAFGMLSGNGQGAAELIQRIRGMIPDLTKVLTIIADDFGPPLQNAITQIFHLFVLLTDNVQSPVAKALNAFADILSLVNSILDKFTGLQHVLGSAFELVTGALLINKIQKLVTGVDLIAVGWQKVKTNTDAASSSAERYGGAEASAGAAGIAGGAAGGIGVFGRSATTVADEAALSGSRSRVSSLLGKVGGKVGLAGIGIPLAIGVGAQGLSATGLTSAATANTISSVAGMAETGAMIGSFIEPVGGTLVGAGIGAGIGLLGAGGSGPQGPNAQQRYLSQLSAKGFDPTQIQGGASNITQANRYQTFLNQSRQQLLSQRAKAMGTGTPNALTMTQVNRLASSGSDFAKAVQPITDLTKQLALNKQLSSANESRLKVEQKQLAVEKAKTAELAKQTRASQSRDYAANLGKQYGQEFNILTKGGMSGDSAVQEVLAQMESRAKKLNPAGAQVLFQGGTAWLDQLKKKHPELSKEYDSWNTEMKATLKKMGVTMATSGGTVLQATTKTWKQIKQAMQEPTERGREQVSKSFTAIQNDGVAVLEGLGQTAAQATLIIDRMEQGKPGPTAAQLAAASNAGKRAVQQAAQTGGARGARHAMGGRIAGMGLNDTVPIGGLAAPGELIVNRHTESKVNAALARSGKTLGGLVAGETKRHSDILPGFATGGRVGMAISEANRINSLRSTYQYGGGHVTPAPATPPWDCSSSTSRVLQAAGYDIPTMTAAQFMNWGEPGEGAIGVEASPGHVYMMLNGKPWGTSYSNFNGLAGPGWIQNGTGYRAGFVKRHAPGATSGGAASALKALGVTGGKNIANMVALGFAGRLATTKAAATPTGGGGGGGAISATGTSGSNQALARSMMLQHGWAASQWPSLQNLWTMESGFSTTAKNASSGAYGIPQALPASKMRSAGSDWQTNPSTQIAWGLNYIAGRYGSPSGAWSHEMSHNPHWYAKGGRLPEWGGWHKDGLDRTFDRPTMIGVGEAGREHVKVTPKGQSGGGISIGDINITIQGGENMTPTSVRRQLDQWAEDFARKLESMSLVEG